MMRSRETFCRELQISPRVRLSIQSAKGFISVLKSSSRSTYSLQSIYDWYLTTHINQNSDYSDVFNMHLNDFEIGNDFQINQKMKSISIDQALHAFVLSKCNTYQEYINLRTLFTKNYSAAVFMSYVVGSTLYLSDITFDYVTAAVYIHPKITQSHSLHNKNIHALRLSPAITRFIGETGIYGILAPSLIAIAKSITQKEFPFGLILSTFLADMHQVGNSQQEQWSQVKTRFFEKIYWLYSQDYGSYKDGKNEICPRIHSILQIIQENQQNNHQSISHKYWF